MEPQEKSDPNPPPSISSREVTHALAETGLYFKFARNPDVGDTWHLSYSFKGDEPVLVAAFVREGPHLVVAANVSTTPGQNRYEELLRINNQLMFAKVALDDESNVVVWAQLPPGKVDAALLRIHLDAVLTGMLEVRKVLRTEKPK